MIEKSNKNYCCIVSLFLIINIFTNIVSSEKTVATIAVGFNPAGIALTPDNAFAYIANNNNDAVPGGDTVSVLNLKNNTVNTMISDPSFNQPYTVTINKTGTTAYVTNSNSTTISIIDTATNAVTGTIDGFDGPSGMVITPSGTTAYVNNYGGPGGVGSGNGTTVRSVDLQTNAIVGAPIVVGLAPAALAITPNGAFVYVINYVDGNPGTGTVSVIQTSSNTVVATISGFSGPFSIAITPDGTRAYVTNFGSNNFAPIGTTVTAIDLKTNTVIATITLGTQPAGLAITPDGRYVYVSNYNTLYKGPGFTDLTAGQGTVSIIETATNTVIPPTIVVGKSPAAVAIASNGIYAYVPNYTSNTVTVLNILERMWLR
jgi:YVTN family beta-propeller protein